MISRVLAVGLSVIPGWTTWALAAAPLQVAVSIEPHRWLVEQVGGDRVNVQVLVLPGESPETYQPTDAQVTSLMRAAVYFRTGVQFENGPWFEAVSKAGGFEMVDLREGVDLRANDPHIWLSPRVLASQAVAVANALTRLRPEARDGFTANLHRLQGRLTDLDEEIRQRLAPYSGRAFFVFHPSWGYFADDYGLEQVALEIAGQNPSDQELTGLQLRARQAGISTVFVQPQIHGQAARAFAAGIGARIEVLDPLAAEVALNLLQTAEKLAQAFAGEGSDGF